MVQYTVRIVENFGYIVKTYFEPLIIIKYTLLVAQVIPFICFDVYLILNEVYDNVIQLDILVAIIITL